MARMMDTLATEQGPTYPPYNIEKLSDENVEGDAYQITMAVAGFAEEDLSIEVKESELTIAGRKQVDDGAEAERNFLYRGIAERAFERKFNLADHIKVDGALLEHGLLHVKLVREVPEEKKARSIAIGTAKSSKKLTKAA